MSVIRNFVAKQIFKKQGVIGSSKSVNFSTEALEKRLKNYGFDPNVIQNEKQLQEILAIVKRAEDSAFKEQLGSILKGKKFDKEADVFEIETGKKIPPGSKIMGGRTVDDDLPPPGSRGGKDDIAAPVQSAEETLKNMTEAELKEKFMRENKEAVARIKNKKLIDDAIDNVSIGFSGDRRTDAELVAAEIAERRGLNIDDLDTRQRAKIYGEAYEALTKKKFDPDNMAQGGRVGLKDGIDRRTFLKIMGGLASIPLVGKFFKGAKVASKAAPVAKTVSKSTPPSYFFELAETIKKFGKISDGPQERIKIHSMKAKDGKSELMLTEDIGTGEMQIKKIGKENDEMISEVQTMEYSPSSALSDESGKVAGQYDEYTEFNSRIIKDEYNDPIIEEGIKVDEIIGEVKEAPPIKKASGGLAYMLGE